MTVDGREIGFHGEEGKVDLQSPHIAALNKVIGGNPVWELAQGLVIHIARC